MMDGYEKQLLHDAIRHIQEAQRNGKDTAYMRNKLDDAMRCLRDLSNRNGG